MEFGYLRNMSQQEHIPQTKNKTIKGFDGNAVLESYQEDICESIPYRATNTEDCRAHEYTLDEAMFNATVRDSSDRLSGIWNIEPCDKSYHAFNSNKYVMSRPHFQQSKSLQDFKAKSNRNGIQLYVDPDSGNVLGGEISYQVNINVTKLHMAEGKMPVQDGFIAPLYWQSRRFRTNAINSIFNEDSACRKIGIGLSNALLVVSCLLACLAVFLYILKRFLIPTETTEDMDGEYVLLAESQEESEN